MKTAKQFCMEYNSEAKHYIKGVDDSLLHNMMEDFADVKSIEFAEWINDNQFTRMDDVWTSTKIHYSGCLYSTTELRKLFNEK